VQCRDDFSLFEDAGLLTQFHEVKRKWEIRFMLDGCH
jgi:hypothetical protein